MLRPGVLLVFQIAIEIAFLTRRQLRRRAYTLLRELGLSERFLYGRAGLHPLRMIAVPRTKVETAVAASGGVVVQAAPDHLAGGMGSYRYYVGVRSH